MLIRLWAALLEALQQRFALFTLELNEEKRRFFGLLIGILIATFAVFLGFFMLNLAVLLLFWDLHTRLAFAFAGFYLIAGVLVIWRLWANIKNAPRPFAATTAEFTKDREFFGNKQ